MNSLCCTQREGLAQLAVTIQRAAGLWGDFITLTDAYVRAFFSTKELCTDTRWNSNHPVWNVTLDFRTVQMPGDFSKVVLQVWDEDFGWDDDLLRISSQIVGAWDETVRICYLDHGRLYYQISMACGPNLGGPACRDYVTPVGNIKDTFLQDGGKAGAAEQGTN